MTATAVIYARVSDRKQAEEEISVPAQIEHGHKLARTLNADVLRVFKDEGRSAFSAGNRRNFEAAVEFAVLMQATYFITWSSARFARNQIETVLFKHQLDRAGVKLRYASMDIDRETDGGWLLDGMLGLFDEMTSRQNAKDTQRSMIRNAQLGYWGGGRAPLGYASQPAPEDPRRRKLFVVPAEAELVRGIFASRIAGFGARAIAEDLNHRGLLNRNAIWNKSTVGHLLRNQVYTGVLVFNRKDRRTARDRPREQWIVVPSHEAIVDAETFNQVQDQMNAATELRDGSPLSRHPFTGILRCGECGSSLQIETARGRSRQYAYYNCRSHQTGQGCRSRRLRADVVDAWLSNIILDRVLSRENLLEVARALEEGSRAKVGERDHARQALQNEMRQLRERNSKLYEVLEAHGVNAPNLGDLTERLQANNARIRGIEQQLVELDRQLEQRFVVTEQEIDILGESLREILAQPDSAAKARQFYGSFIASITVRDRTAEIRYDPARLLPQASPVHSNVKWLPGRRPLRTQCESVTGSTVRVLVVDCPLELAA